jgi:hypothetical protein
LRRRTLNLFCDEKVGSNGSHMRQHRDDRWLVVISGVATKVICLRQGKAREEKKEGGSCGMEGVATEAT